MTPDVNVLVAAFRPDHSHHAAASAWLAAVLGASSETLEILPMVAAAFVRLVTDSRIFEVPDSPHAAHAFLDTLLAADGASMPELGPEWPVFAELCVERKLKGGDVPDAWIAAAVTFGGLHLVTFDRDFARLLRPDQYTLLSGSLRVSESRPVYALPLAA